MTEATENKENNTTQHNANANANATQNGNANAGDKSGGTPDPVGRTTIRIKNFSRIKEKRHYTEAFEVCGCRWRLLIFPHGNDTDNLSVYLDVYDAKNMPLGWSRIARFALEVVNQNSQKDCIRREAHHRFHAEESDWGFTQFMKLSQLHDTRGGYLKDDRLVVNIEVELVKELPGNNHSWSLMWNYDSKKETGYVGLKNQGATCYMNSLLQALFHTPEFRRAVYQLPTDAEQPTKSVQLALQRIFYRLQFGNTSVGTKELTKSFGWTAVDSFTQHDVQELNRVLLDNLQSKMKGTRAEGTVERLFQGRIRNFIRCVNIDYESSREETYFDLSLNVKGCKDIHNSFANYIEVEMLDGNNKYHAEGHGLQAAKKGCMFLSFPPVLHLQLKRFEYDPLRDAMVKVNDKYVFPETLDLSKYLADDADRTCPPIFHLHGVLVHSGDVHGGHYYAFIKPTQKAEWFRFDDERVTRATLQQVTDDNFGGEEEYTYNLQGRKMTQIHKKFSNAYMLVYLRESDLSKLLAPIPDSDIPVHLKERFDREEIAEEMKKKEKAEAHLYMTLRVATDQDMRAHRRFDLVRFEQVREFRVRKASTVKEFRSVAAEAFGIPAERQRYWNWVSRQNKTLRPDAFLSAHDEEVPLEDINKRSSGEVKLYLEATPETPTTHEDDVLIFFKFYDPTRELLQYVGHSIVRSSTKVPNLVPLMNNLIGLPPTTPLLVFEEVKPTMVDALRPNLTLKEAELSNGDILVFQKALDLREQHAALGLPSAQDYYDYILNRVSVKFRRLDTPKRVAFVLELSQKMLYDQVTAKVAAKLGTDPAKIRLTAHNAYYDQPKPNPIKRGERITLLDMLTTYYQPISDSLFFEALEIPVSEFENKRSLKVAWHMYNTQLGDTLSVLLPRDATVGDILQQISSAVKRDPVNGSGKLRLMEVWTSKIHKVLSEDDPITTLNDYAKLRAEEVPKEELAMEEGDKRIPIAHFHRDYNAVHPHSNPFYMVVKKDETLSQLRVRIGQRLGFPEEELAKWRVAIVTFGRPDFLHENDIVAKHEFATADYLGLEHSDTTSSRQNKPHIVEKPIKIYG